MAAGRALKTAALDRLPRGFGRRLALIALGALSLRLFHTLVVARDVTGIGDYFFYHWQANLLAEGRGFIDPNDLTFKNEIQPSAGHPPLWPLFLAGVSKLGGTSFLAHKAAGGVLGALAVVAIGLLGRRVAGPRVGLLAAAIAALYPALVAADGSLLTETLYGLIVALCLLAALRLHERPGPATAALLGALIALAGLARSEALLLLPLLAVPLAWRGGAGRALRVVAACVAVALVLAPWTIRNLEAFDRLVLVSTNDGTVLAGANCPATFAGPDIGNWRLDCISSERERNEAAQSERWRREGIDYARDHAGRLALVVGVRVLRSFDLYQPRRQVGYAEGRHRRTQQAGIAVYFLLLLPAIYGAIVLRRRSRGVLLVLLSPFVLVIVTSAVGYGISRFRHAAEIPLVVLAALGLEAIWRRREKARSGAPSVQ